MAVVLTPCRSDPGILRWIGSEPAAKINGRVTYSQQILKEYGWIEDGKGRGMDIKGSGYSLI